MLRSVPRRHQETHADNSAVLHKDLRAIFGDGLAFSVMVGLGETYVPAFALALGMSEVMAGWIVALPMVFGAALQLVSPAGVHLFRSHRRWVVACAFAQALSFAGFVAVALAGGVAEIVVFLIAALYWGAGMATGAAWNTWIGTLIPRPLRAGYFAVRNRACQAAVMAGVVAGGLSLQAAIGSEHLLMVFAVLFLAAGLSRVISSFLLWSQSEPHPMPANFHNVSGAELLKRAWSSADGRLLLYLLVVQSAVQIAGPFFTPYMLGEIKFSYAQYLLLICTAFAAKMVTFPFLGRFAKRFGSQRLLYASGLGIVPLSALWIVSSSLWYLLAIQVMAGVFWAGYELSTFLLLFERIDESERTSVLTTYNFANAVAFGIGSLIGGFVLSALGEGRESYYAVFGLSGAVRVVALVFLARLRQVTFKPVPLASGTLAVRANTGSIPAPIVTSLATNGENGEHSGRPEAPAGPGIRPAPAAPA